MMLRFVNARNDKKKLNEIKKLYDEAFKSSEYITPMVQEDSYHSYYIYALKHNSASEIVDKLKNEGIQCGSYYPVPLHLQGAFAHLGYKKGDLPITEELSKTTFAIPVFPEIYEEERNYVIEKVLKALED